MELLKLIAVAIGAIVGLFTVIRSLYAAWDWYKIKKESSKEDSSDNEESIAERFVKLFEAHGVYRNQIPLFFGRGLTISDVQTDEELVKKLDHQVLSEACDLFQVSIEWLSHGNGEIFPTHAFYKHPSEFGEFIDSIRAGNPDAEIEGYVLKPKPPYKHHNDTLILLKEEIGIIKDRRVFRYHFCPEWILSYWKCCADIACCISQAQQRDIYLTGKVVSVDWIRSLMDGMKLPEYDFEMADISFPSYGYWSCDEFIDNPKLFSAPLEERRDDYSVVSAIERWLKYHDKGQIYVYSESENRSARLRFKEYISN